MSFIILALYLLLVLSIILGVIFYRKYYEQKINSVLLSGEVVTLLSLRTFHVIWIAFLLVFTSVVNVFPIYDINNVNIIEKEEELTVVHNPYYSNKSYKHYSMKTLEDESAIISYTYDQVYCYLLDEPCLEGFDHSSTKIAYYNSVGTELWSLEGSSNNNAEIVYNNHLFEAIAVSDLTDGSFVAVVKTLDQTSNELNLGLLYINSTGNITGLDIIDLEAFGYKSMTHDFAEITKDDNGGFLLKYSSPFNGTFLQQYDDSNRVVWTKHLDQLYPLTSTSYSNIPTSSQTVFRVNDGYLFIYGRTVVRILNDGSEVWHKKLDVTPTSIDMADDSILITAKSTSKINRTSGLYTIEEDRTTLKHIHIIELQASSGEELIMGDFTYKEAKTHQLNTYLTPVYAYKMDDTYQVIALGIVALDTVAPSIINIEFNSRGTSLGYDYSQFTYLNDTTSFNEHVRSDYQVNIKETDNKLEIISPIMDTTILLYKDELKPVLSEPIDFNMIEHNNMLQVRMYINYGTTIILSLVICYMIIDQFRKEGKRQGPYYTSGK